MEELKLFSEPEELSLHRPTNPFFELYEGQHNSLYRDINPAPEPEPKKKIKMNDPTDIRRQKFIDKIRNRKK